MGELVAKQKRIADLENRHRNMTKMAVIGSSPVNSSPGSKDPSMHAQQLTSPPWPPNAPGTGLER